MPPTDNMPDFDSMSPEEIQAWMETLAERQGATEGFTTDKRMDVQEIDPDSVEVKDEYIPYGKTREEWEQIQVRERAERDARKTSPAPISAVSQTPAPQPAPAASADAMPDFDSMTPEQLQVWMESLAARQGATEGLTTNERMDIPEIDPDSVSIKDDYIPYGKSRDEWEEIQARERAERDARKTASVSQTSAPKPAPQEELVPESMDWLSELATPPSVLQAEEEPAFEMPDFSNLGGDLSDLDLDLGGLDLNADLDLDLEALDLGSFGQEDSDPLQWLDGLVAEQEHDDVVLPDFKAELPQEKPELPMLETEDGAEDTLEWLESLAKRQGADENEFVTGAGFQFEVPDLNPEPLPFDRADEDEEEYEIDVLDEVDDELESEDPAAWLDSLAESHKFSAPNVVDSLFDEYEESDKSYENVSTEKILADLNRGVSDPSMMKDWMDNLLERGATRDDVPDYIEEDEEEEQEPTLEANIPDWLLEQVGNAPPDALAQSAPDTDDQSMLSALNLDAALDAALEVAPEAAADMPAWLSEDVEEEALFEMSNDDSVMPEWLQGEIDTGQAEAISAEIPEWLNDNLDEPIDEIQAVFTKPNLAAIAAADDEIDINDSWVEAFELERQMQMQGLDEMPEEWLEGDLPFIEMPKLEMTLQEAVFAEEELPSGEPEAVPGWIDTSAEAMPIDYAPAPEMEIVGVGDDFGGADLPDWLREQQDTYVEEMPEWLAETGMETEDVPDWLLETISTDEEVFDDMTPVVLEQAPEPVHVPAPAPRSPAPVPVNLGFDPEAALRSAKEKVAQGQLDAALTDYENVVRANKNLNVVVEDLTKLVKDGSQKHNAAVYRVLGDGLMRQGKLQEALDTYRKALNLL